MLQGWHMRTVLAASRSRSFFLCHGMLTFAIECPGEAISIRIDLRRWGLYRLGKPGEPPRPVPTLAGPYPIEIVQAPPGQITMLFELNHQIRVIRMGKPLPKYEELVAYPAFNGYSVGWFEGDTLVVETGGFKEKTYLDATGAPHTDELTTVERIRRISP